MITLVHIDQILRDVLESLEDDYKTQYHTVTSDVDVHNAIIEKITACITDLMSIYTQS